MPLDRTDGAWLALGAVALVGVARAAQAGRLRPGSAARLRRDENVYYDESARAWVAEVDPYPGETSPTPHRDWVRLGAWGSRREAMNAILTSRSGSRNDLEDDEPEYEYPDEDTLQENVTISTPAWGKITVAYGGKLLSRHDSLEDARRAALRWMQGQQFWPDIYVVNERGNIDLIDAQGNVLASWV